MTVSSRRPVRARALTNALVLALSRTLSSRPSVADDFNLAYATQFATNFAEAGGSSADAPLLIEPLPPLPDGELNDDQIAERMTLLQCEWVDAEQTEMRGTTETDADGVHALLDRIGADYCKLLIPDREYVFQRSEHGERRLEYTSDARERLADDSEWLPLEGGPWTATLMRPSRQPVSTATYRNFQLPVGAVSKRRTALPLPSDAVVEL